MTFLGIDVGTSSVKTLLVDESQAVLDEASTPLTVRRPRPLWSEQDPEDWWRATEKTVAEIRSRRPRDLAALKVIAAWRERRAQDTDQPRSRILKDDALIELAMQRPATPEAFDKLRAVQRGYGRSSAAQELKYAAHASRLTATTNAL